MHKIEEGGFLPGQAKFHLSFKGVKDATSSPLLSKVKRTITRHGLLQLGDRVVVALSGGIDSMVLLHLLLSLKIELELHLHIAHLNHMFREESRHEADLIGELVLELGLPSTICSIDVPKLQKEKGLSPQEAARQARYGFLVEVADREKANRIALGHHLDDQAETVIINLLRGSGTRGLAGIPIIRGSFVRPLLEVSRRDIQRHAKSFGIPYLEDPSNREEGYLRNRVRLELLPYLAKAFNPRICETLAETAEVLREDDTFLSRLTEEALSSVILSKGEGKICLSLPGLEGLPCALRRRAMRETVRIIRGDILPPPGRFIAALEDAVLKKKTGAQIPLGKGLVAVFHHDDLILKGGEERLRRIETTSLALPGRTYIPTIEREIVTKIVENRNLDFKKIPKGTAFMDFETIRPPIYLRSRREGDRFYPLGLGGQKKLQDFFVDCKVARHERDLVPILVDSEKVIWVVGMRVDERVRVKAETEQVLIVELKEAPYGAQAGKGPFDRARDS